VESSNEKDLIYKFSIKCSLSVKHYEKSEPNEFLRLYQKNVTQKISVSNSFSCFCMRTLQIQKQITQSTQTHKRKHIINDVWKTIYSIVVAEKSLRV
jgi:hypothetical protein